MACLLFIIDLMKCAAHSTRREEKKPINSPSTIPQSTAIEWLIAGVVEELTALLRQLGAPFICLHSIALPNSIK